MRSSRFDERPTVSGFAVGRSPSAAVRRDVSASAPSVASVTVTRIADRFVISISLAPGCELLIVAVPEIPDEPFDAAARFGRPFELDGDPPGDLDAVLHRAGGERRKTRAHPRTRRHGGDEPYAVESIVEGEPRHAEGERPLQHHRDQRQRQKPMRDRRTEWRLAFGARRIDMDPLPIVGRVGELIDARLRDLEPLADRNFLPDAML